MLKVAVAQVGSVLFDTASTLQRVEKLCEEAASGGVRLIVFPEALLGGYPKGLDFGTVVGSRSDAGMQMFARYFKSAVVWTGEYLTSVCSEEVPRLCASAMHGLINQMENVRRLITRVRQRLL
jgi:nitrilase